MALSLSMSYFPRLLNGPPIPTNESFKYEALRLKTFSAWTSYDRASPIYLAKAGFYYTGNEDVVQCFSCHITKGDWRRNLNPLIIHHELNPDCTFCREMENVNFPFYVPDQSEYDQIQDTLHRQYCGDDTPVVSSTGLSRQVLDNSDYSSASYRQNQTQTNFPVVATDAGTAETSRQAIGVRGALGRGHDSEAAPTREEFAPMKQESNRFSSFDSTWPRQDTPDPRDLARAGFYYTGTVDRVQCAFCRGILRNWDEDDVPIEEHRRHFPMCPFVMGLDVGNIPDPTALIAANRTSEFMSVTQPSAVVSDASLGIVTERPKHAQYAVEAARITSFRNWPSGKEQTPQSLAKAGFFYAGFGDSVKCFFCDGGLRTWERGDDPWVEHARWFPRCPYVKQVKGEDFIKSAMEGQEPSTATTTTTTGDNSSSLPQPPATGTTRKLTSAGSHNVDPRELSSRMDSPTVQTVLQMDIPRERVARVIQKRLQETGDDFPSVEALMEAIFHATNDASSNTAAPAAPQARPFEPEVTADSGEIGSKDNQNTEEKMVEDDEDDEDSLGDSDSQSLLQENRELKEQRQCKICMDAEVNVVFLPCGHLVCCASCAPALPKCPICRATIRGTVRTFMS